jgi:hypothetical protein
MAFIPLSTLVPAWDARYVPEVYAYIEKGIRRLQARFWLARYVVVSFTSSCDENSYLTGFDFEIGVKTPEEALQACRQVLRYRMVKGQIGPYTEHWRVKENEYFEAIELSRIPPRIDILAWETRGDHFHSFSVYVGVIEVDPLHPLTGEDLGAMGKAHELIPYLRKLGGDQRL